MNFSAAELTAGIDVGLATDGDLPRWDAFVAGCPEATFFHRAGWKEVIAQSFGHRTYYLLAERAGSLVGILPLAEIKSLLFGHSLVSLPFCVYGGVAATDPAAVPLLHAAARELAEGLGVAHLELKNPAPVHDPPAVRFEPAQHAAGVVLGVRMPARVRRRAHS